MRTDKKTKKTAGIKRKSQPRAGRRKMTRGVPEQASCTDISSLPLLNSNQMYQNYNSSLSASARATAIAKGYQFYRIKRVTFIVKPLFDTFANGGGSSVPHLYYMIDRTRSLQAANSVQALKQLGATPKRLDDKVIRFSFTPSVLTGTYDNTPAVSTQFVQYKLKPWLPTRDTDNLLTWNPDTTDHLGIIFVVENAGGNNVQFSIERQVEYEFKKPSYTLVSNLGYPEPVDIEDLIITEPLAEVKLPETSA